MKKRLMVLILVLALLLGPARPVAVAAGGDNVPFTRGTFCMFLVEHLGLSNHDISGVENPFADISPEDACYTAALICFDLGLVFGMSDGNFAPDGPMTRATAAVVLVRAGQGGEAVEALPGDVSASSWYCQSVCEILGSGVMSLDSEGNFNPNATACPADIDTTKMTPMKTGQEEERLLCSLMIESDAGLVEEIGEDGAPVLREFTDLFVRAGDEAYIKVYYGTMDQAAMLSGGNLGSSDIEMLWVEGYTGGEDIYYIQALAPGAVVLSYTKLTVGADGFSMLRHTVDLDITMPTAPAFYSARERSADTYLGLAFRNAAAGYDPVNGTVLWLMSESGFSKAELENIVILVSGPNSEDGLSMVLEPREEADDRYDIKVELAPGLQFADGSGIISALDTSGEQPYTAFAQLTLIEMGLPCTIGSITVRDSNNQETDAIPVGLFFVTVELTNFSSVNNDTLILAAYDERGQMLEVQFYPAASNTRSLSAVFINNDGRIATIRAFVISMDDMAPRATAVSVGA